MGGPDGPRGRPEQRRREGLRREEGGAGRRVGGVVRPVRDGAAHGDGRRRRRHGGQVSRYDLRRQRLALKLFTKGQLDLTETKTKHGQHEQTRQDVHVWRTVRVAVPRPGQQRGVRSVSRVPVSKERTPGVDAGPGPPGLV